MQSQTCLARASEQQRLPLLAGPCGDLGLSAKSCCRGVSGIGAFTRPGVVGLNGTKLIQRGRRRHKSINQDDFEIEQNNYRMTDK
jgi:hypothetical protein